MEQKKYLSDVDDLTPAQQEELIAGLTKLAVRCSLHGKKIRWEELHTLRPELACYSVPTLRHYLQLCSSFWVFRKIEIDDEGFVQRGLTEWGQSRSRMGAVMWLLARFLIVCGCMAIGWVISELIHGAELF